MWFDALKTVAAEYSDVDGAWGDTDCCQFINSYYSELHGIDHADQFDYAGGTGALKILSKHGGMKGLLTHVLGEPKDRYPGCIVTVDLGDESVGCGVYNGYCVFAILPEKGLVRISPEKIKDAW